MSMKSFFCAKGPSVSRAPSYHDIALQRSASRRAAGPGASDFGTSQVPYFAHDDYRYPYVAYNDMPYAGIGLPPGNLRLSVAGPASLVMDVPDPEPHAPGPGGLPFYPRAEVPTVLDPSLPFMSTTMPLSPYMEGYNYGYWGQMPPGMSARSPDWQAGFATGRLDRHNVVVNPPWA